MGGQCRHDAVKTHFKRTTLIEGRFQTFLFSCSALSGFTGSTRAHWVSAHANYDLSSTLNPILSVTNFPRLECAETSCVRVSTKRANAHLQAIETIGRLTHARARPTMQNVRAWSGDHGHNSAFLSYLLGHGPGWDRNYGRIRRSSQHGGP